MSTPGLAATILPVDRLTPYLRVRISTDGRSLSRSRPTGAKGSVYASAIEYLGRPARH